jgi:hypothetical protein
MVPSSYNAYFAATATGAAALIGLLFVAISVRDQTIFGPKARAGGEALAITAFGGLVNSLVLSLLGLIPQANIGVGAITLAVVSSVTVIRLHSRLHWARNTILLSLAVIAYALEFYYGIVLQIHPHDSDAVNNISYVVFATLVISLQRAWSLLKGKHIVDSPADPGPDPQPDARP